MPDAPSRLDSGEVLDLLASLVQRSPVVYEEDEQGHGRYRLLETVRQYARDPLIESGEAESVRDRHLDFFLQLAERAEPELGRHQQIEWLERLEREHDNLRAALAWCVGSGVRGQGSGVRKGERGDPSLSDLTPDPWPLTPEEMGPRLGGRLVGFWEVRGYWTEGREHLAGLLAMPGAEARTSARARALHGAGMLAHWQWEWGEARALHEESLALFRELGDQFGIPHALGWLGLVLREQGEYGAARAIFEEKLAILRERGNKGNIALALDDLGGTVQLQGEYGTAALYEESLAFFRELGNTGGIASSFLGLAHVEQAQGNPGRARALLEEAHAIGQGPDFGFRMAVSCMAQGHLLLEMGDYQAARSRYEEVLTLRRERGGATGLIASALLEVGHAAWLQGEPGVTQAHAREALALFQEGENQAGLLAALENLAAAALAQGKQERAARLLGAVEAQRQALGLPAPDWWRRPRERISESVRAASLEQAFAAEWAEGRAMPLAQAIE